MKMKKSFLSLLLFFVSFTSAASFISVPSSSTNSTTLTLTQATKSSAYTLTSSDAVIRANAAAAAFTLTLPSAASVTDKVYQVIKTDSTFNAVTISDGTFSTTANTQGESVSIQSDGTTYLINRRDIPSVWVTYTPTFAGGGAKGTISRDVARWRRVRDSIEVRYDFFQTTGNSTGSAYTISLPSGLSFDTNKIPNATNGAGVTLGYGNALSSATVANTFYPGVVSYNSTTAVAFLAYDDAVTNKTAIFGSNPLGLGQANLGLTFQYLAAITGWN